MMKNILKIILLAYLLQYTTQVNSQMHIRSQVTGNYWQHSELIGVGIGIGISYAKSNYSISLNYDYGYGTCDRIKKFDNVNYDNYSTVLLDIDKGKWKEYLGILEEYSNYTKGISDYAKQHQLSIMIGYNISKKKNWGLTLSTGVYGAVVEHFFTYKNIPIHYVDLVPFYQGPLNYIPVATQKIITFGINFETSLNVVKNNKIWSPFIAIGLGPNYGSFIGLGLRLSAIVVAK